MKGKIVLLLVAVLMCSCVSRKQLAYFRPVTAESAAEINKSMKPQPEPRVKINDALIITVSALDPEAVIPYNLPNVAYSSPTSSTIPTTAHCACTTTSLGLLRHTLRARPKCILTCITARNL